MMHRVHPSTPHGFRARDGRAFNFGRGPLSAPTESQFGEAATAQWHEVLRWPHDSPGVRPAHWGWFYGPLESAKWILQGLMVEAWLHGREARFGLRNAFNNEFVMPVYALPRKPYLVT